MNGWNQNQDENQPALEKYSPRNLTDQKDFSKKLREIEKSDMQPEIKQQTMENVRSVWEKANKRIMDSVDTYIDELYEKERKKL